MKPVMITSLLAALLGAGGPALAADPHAGHGVMPGTAVTPSILGTGTVKSVDTAKGEVLIDHDPITALKWPRMVMNFQLADQALAGKVKAGDKVKFEMKEGEKYTYFITAIEPVH